MMRVPIRARRSSRVGDDQNHLKDGPSWQEGCLL
jgi:hypothetical protein